jgi:hypothetical protein
MTKKDFIALADIIRMSLGAFPPNAVFDLANFCQERNPRFNRERWLGYINGTNGPNGGKP